MILPPGSLARNCDLRPNKQELVLQHQSKTCLELFFQPTYLFSGLKSKKSIFSGTGVWNFFNKCQFVGKRQKIKGRAIKHFLFSSKSEKTWIWLWSIVKNGRFHPTTHLSWSVNQLRTWDEDRMQKKERIGSGEEALTSLCLFPTHHMGSWQGGWRRRRWWTTRAATSGSWLWRNPESL